MEVSEIRDAESLRAWLEALPQGTEAEREVVRRHSVAIAHRAAMRVFPVYWAWTLTESSVALGNTALPLLRCANIVGAASAVRSNTDFGPIAVAARSVTGARAWTNHGADDANLSGAKHVTEAATVAGLVLLALEAIYRPGFASFSEIHEIEMSPTLETDGSVWEMVRRDCSLLGQSIPISQHSLWEKNNPLAKIWADTRPKILAQGDGWQFWVDWYENALHGRLQDYDLLTKIALIDPEDWDKGADHVNALIQKITAAHKPKHGSTAPPPSTAVIQRVRSAVEANGPVLALQLGALQEVVAQEAERVRGANSLDPEVRDSLLDALGKFQEAAQEILRLLPQSGPPSDDTVEQMVGWAEVLKSEALHWNTEAKKIVAGKSADERVARAGRLMLASALAGSLSLMGAGPFAAVAGGYILLGGKLDISKAKNAINSIIRPQ